ncbi:hypothetical protein HMPREF0541_00854 [Lacticaseibacillus rhamnosus ATCC 21052]|nr:hypothetical protein HMPREF0541_00854 [Lacticaseibacillus rhamnosus ATCC 21052]
MDAMARNLRVRTLGAMAKPTITPEAAYTPIPNRAGSRSLKKSLQLPQVGNCKLLN